MSALSHPSQRAWLALAAVALALLVPAGSAAAATVTSTDDSGPGTLRQLVADVAPGDTIEVPPGEYTLTSGEIVVDKSLTIAGAGAAEAIVSGGKSSRIFLVQNEEADVTISGLTLRDGRLTDVTNVGAAIFSQARSLTLRADVLTDNLIDAADQGRLGGVVQGVALFSIDQHLTIADTRIVDNVGKADGGEGSGGFISGGAVLAVVDDYRIERSTIAGNAMQALGGAAGPEAKPNGGLVEGAGLLVASSGASQIVDSTISGNSATVTGGPGGAGGEALGAGLRIVGLSNKNRVSNTTVAGNTIEAGDGIGFGGGIALSAGEESTGELEVFGSTIATNSVAGSGDAIAGGNVFARGSTIAFANTIVANGIGPAGSENCATDAVGALTSLGFNLESGDECGFGVAGDLVGIDPLLGPLADNGGPTLTLAPVANSPAVDAGNSAGLDTDQRGLPRPVDQPNADSTAPGADGADIGAVELQD